MFIDLTMILIIAATIVTGLLAGASLDKAIVQLPARHHMEITGFSAFSRANDLGNGLVFYPVLGVSATLLTILAAISAMIQRTPLAYTWPLYVAVLLAVLHSITTARAAPKMLSLRQLPIEEATLVRTLDRFAAWHNLRAVLQFLNFLILVWAIITYINVLL